MKTDLIHQDPIKSSAFLHELIVRLIKYYHAIAPELLSPEKSDILKYSDSSHRILSLKLAEILLRDSQIPVISHTRPLQVAVIGPTQTGKSTFINLILNKNVAEASPLAGFTKHPHAIALNGHANKPDWLIPFFSDWECIQYESETTENKNYFYYSSIDFPESQDVISEEIVIWDTPDFDSLSAHNYRQGFLEAAALADAFIVLLTPEKYSDRSAWDTLQFLLELKRPVLICLNKVTQESEEILRTALLDKISKLQSEESQITTVVFPKLQKIDSFQDISSTQPGVTLQKQFYNLISQIKRPQRLEGSLNFINNHWDNWFKAVTEEHEASDTWNHEIDTLADNALTLYNTSFLDHPQRFDTFKRALIELLYLLEIPFLASALSNFRQLITWPVRQLFKGKKLLNGKHSHIIENSAQKMNYEEKILFDVLTGLYSSLSRVVIDQCQTVHTPLLWQLLNKRIAEKQNEFEKNFEETVHQYNDAFKPEIQAAANKLYEQLQKKPALLNTLRAARVTTDAAAIALALKSGGLGLHDFFVAPAMVAFTSILTESALGSYMTSVASDLRKRQLAFVKQEVFVNGILPKLRLLLVDLDDLRISGISRKEYTSANLALDTLRHVT